ncbi:MAG TPA: MBL fold metallo-hydrolase [Mogibacterium sp.]|nr:MBL fold metallo-hydrolase [Mogibacterium sp.]
MSVEVISAGSSSSGNSYIVKAGGKKILIDVGISAKRIISALCENLIAPENIDAVLITHEHIDHVKSLRTIARMCPNAVFFASEGTISACDKFSHVPDERCRTISSGDKVSFDGVNIKTFDLSHDANEPVGYSIVSDKEQLTLITDTGIVTEEMFEEIRTADKLVIESNHEVDMLMCGNYPYLIKRRIKGDYGHLSNESCGKAICRMLIERNGISVKKTTDGEADNIASNTKIPSIMLAHLSENNNAPFYARQTVECILKDEGFIKGRDYSLTVATKEGICSLNDR